MLTSDSMYALASRANSRRKRLSDHSRFFNQQTDQRRLFSAVDDVAQRGGPETMDLTHGKTTFFGMLSSVGAVLAACSCCILPVALAGIGLSTGLSSVMSPLGPLQGPMAALSFVLVAFSWIVVLRQRRQAWACGPSKFRSWLRTPKILMLIMASAFSLTAVSWKALEPALMRAML